MKRLLLIFLLIIALYIAKPLWEEPVSQVIDLSFLEPIDQQIARYINKETLSSTIHELQQKIDDVIFFVSTKSAEIDDWLPEKVDKPSLDSPEGSLFSIHNLEIGATKEEVLAELGEPQNTSYNEYGTEWHTYHENYQNFVMVSFDEKDQINALYTNDQLISSTMGIQYGSTKTEVREVLGKPIQEIRKGMNVYVLQKDPGLDVFKIDNLYVYVFYDLHQQGKMTALLLLTTDLEKQKNSLYATHDSALQFGFEQQLFDLTNAARVRHGRSILQWNDEVARTARKHSLDMAKKDYFSHDNLEGLSPFDRMEMDGIYFKKAGENLAYGQTSSIFAHEGLMNSKGHRENILIENYSHLGIGVAFNKKSQPYYTENFILK